ncbi:MAG TPA: hypothetical protein VFH95_05635 [Candidatus Kapabacteria bacterium]|nr:hypothetical protein [Candidatus Kapabacteria bacterium]
MKTLLTALFFFFFLASLALPELTFPALAQSMTITGTMHRSSLEGGCWYLQSDVDRGRASGKQFELTGDTGIVYPLRVEGMHVVIEASPVKDAASTCMIGEIVRVTRRLDTVRYPTDLAIMAIEIDGTVHRTKSGVWYVKTSHGREYEFEKLPPKEYRHVGAALHQKYRVLLDKKSTKTGKDGVILSESPHPAKPLIKQRKYDIR